MYGGSVYVEDVEQGLLSVVVAFQLVKHTSKFVAQHARVESVRNLTLAHDSNVSRALIVDDNKLQVKLLGKVCTDSGFTVESAFDGSEAVEMMRERGAGFYNIVFCDIVMPKMNGVEATLRMRKIDSTVPIYAISANGFDSDFDEIVRAGATAGFSKPVPRDTIYSVLTQASKVKRR
ncbi:CheY-like superfamily protein [Tribonema minus]|uniref:CheY-like superfamily protein n=1 Tax=Tribonema minus TaxID=303371 RepID=A0A835Z4K3_9STRA|nr:CheY-like superfamily protein [Tribonema minus]